MQRLTQTFLAQQADKEALFIPDDRQRALSRGYLWPVREILESDLLRLRARFDPEFIAQNPGAAQRYPIGYCREISNGVLNLLKREITTSTSAGLEALRRFCVAGGVFKAVWGDLRHSYFQNAWQIGDMYVDVANDSVVRTKPKVEILPFEKAEFYAIDNYQAYARLAESYWHTRVLPNRYLPQLAPLYPMLMVYPNGGVKLHSPYQTPFYQNLLSCHELAEDFVFSSAWSANRLSESERAGLKAWVKRVEVGEKLYESSFTDEDLRGVFENARKTELRFDPQRCQAIINQALVLNALEPSHQKKVSSLQCH